MTISLPTVAIPMPPVPTEPIYFEPPIVEETEDIYKKSCVEIDAAIRAIHPYRYSYKPKFGQDRYNAIAVASVGINGMLSAAFLGYSSIVEDKEQRRILGVEQQIAMLQQVKAEKHCFE